MAPVKYWLIRIFIIGIFAAGAIWFKYQIDHRPKRVEVAGRNKILLLGNGTDIETLDPHMATGVPEHHIITALFEGLVAPDADDPDKDAPGVAEKWESPDFVTWTFHLRHNAKWSDGTPLTALDFIYAYKRLLSPKLLADYAEMLHIIRGAAAFNKGQNPDFSQVGVTAADNYTLIITLDGPAPYFPSMLKHYAWFPVPRHAIERYGAMDQPDVSWARPGKIVSNGPFQLKEWVINHYIAVTKNPQYWDSGMVKLKEIHFFPTADSNTEERQYKGGQLHVTDTVPLDKIPFYRETKPPDFYQSPELSTEFYRCNVTKPPLNDARVRRALALALDREEMVTKILRGGQQPATGMTPPLAGDGYEVLHVVKFDLVEARRLLAEAGFKDGKGFPKFDILTNNKGNSRTVAEYFQEAWRKNLGIEIGVRQQEWQVYLDSMRKGDYTLCRAGWTGDYPDPFTFLSIWRSFDGNNYTGWKNAKYDELMAASTHERDSAKRREILRAGEEILLDEMPAIPMNWRQQFELRRPEVLNWHRSVISHRCYKALDLALPPPPSKP